MSILLRYAPWVDLEVTREDVLKRVKRAGFSGKTMKMIESYEKGEVPTLPNSYSVADHVIYAVTDLYSTQLDRDRRFYDGAEAIKQYFINASYWREVSDGSS
jgi:hypothetical protein